MTPYEMGKYAALSELGFYKDAGFVDWLKRVFGRTAPAAEAAAVAPKVRAPRRKPAGPAPNQVLGENARPTNGAYTAPTEVLSEADAAAAAKLKETTKAEEKGFLSSIPWWGKGLGLGAIGYGGYKMLAPPKQEAEGMQPYYGPGNGRY